MATEGLDSDVIDGKKRFYWHEKLAKNCTENVNSLKGKFALEMTIV